MKLKVFAVALAAVIPALAQEGVGSSEAGTTMLLPITHVRHHSNGNRPDAACAG